MDYSLRCEEEELQVKINDLGEGRYSFKIGEGVERVIQAEVLGDLVQLRVGSESHPVTVTEGPDGFQASCRGRALSLEILDPRALLRQQLSGIGGQGESSVVSPMPGRVVKLLVEPGEHVKQGQGLIIVEAMKMENELKARMDGEVLSIEVAPGDTVEAKAPLVILKPL